jgi:hypothetical protein
VDGDEKIQIGRYHVQEASPSRHPAHQFVLAREHFLDHTGSIVTQTYSDVIANNNRGGRRPLAVHEPFEGAADHYSIIHENAMESRFGSDNHAIDGRVAALA